MMSQKEWQFAQAESFMFVMPIDVAWEALDSSLISRLFVRHPHVGLQAPLSAASRLQLAASRLHLGCSSAAARLHLGCSSAALRLQHGYLSAVFRLCSATARLSPGDLPAISRRSPGDLPLPRAAGGAALASRASLPPRIRHLILLSIVIMLTIMILITVCYLARLPPRIRHPTPRSARSVGRG